LRRKDRNFFSQQPPAERKISLPAGMQRPATPREPD